MQLCPSRRLAATVNYGARIGARFAVLVGIAVLFAASVALSAGARTPQAHADGLPALVAGPQTNDLGGGLHMTTSVRLSRDYGRLDGHTRTWTDSWVVGGHGSVGVYLLDANGNVIGAGNAHTYGVDAKSIFWGRSDRTDGWTDYIPTQITTRTASVLISHTTKTVDNFQHDLDEAKKKGCAIFQALGQTCPFK
jgi:hypothetical protein